MPVHPGAELGPDSAGAPSSGWLLGERYRVTRRIGAGGTAEVFRARDEVLDRDVAVKVFRTIGVPSDGSSTERREAERQALAQLSHPNLITLFDGSGEDADGPAFVVMELVEGTSLAERIAGGPLPEVQVRDVGTQIAAALAYVHSRGMVHRDVKPANILLGSDGIGGLRARLSDFGIVRVMGSDHITGVHLALGTPHYLAPEQARGDEVGSAADVYSLGLVVLEMLTGVRPYDGEPVQAAVAHLLRPPRIPDELGSPWPELLRAMTADEPGSRPPAAEVARVLTAWPEPDAVTAAASASHARRTDDDEPQQRTRPERRGRHAGLLAAALALAAIVGSGGYLLAHQPAHAPAGPPAGVVSTGPVTRAEHPGTTPRHGAPAPNSTVQQAAKTRPVTTPAARSTPHTTAAPRTTPPASSTAPRSSPSASPSPSSSTSEATTSPSPTSTRAPSTTPEAAPSGG